MTNKLNPNIWNFTRKYRGPISDVFPSVNLPLVGLHISW